MFSIDVKHYCRDFSQKKAGYFLFLYLQSVKANGFKWLERLLLAIIYYNSEASQTTVALQDKNSILNVRIGLQKGSDIPTGNYLCDNNFEY